MNSTALSTPTAHRPDRSEQRDRLEGSKLLTAQARWRLRNPAARAAHMAVQAAIRRGTLVRAPCAECGHPRSDAHHADYSRPLDVEWLCRRHHVARHRKPIVKGPGR